MKSVKFFELFLLALVGSLLLAFTNANGQQLNDFSLRPLQVSYADVPAIASSTDPAVVLQVIYADSCYEFFQSRVSRQLNSEQKLIEIRPYATVVRGMCQQRIQNVQKTVLLGTLPQGQYTVRIYSVGREPIEKPMSIRSTNN
jgi:hypothetical protein